MMFRISRCRTLLVAALLVNLLILLYLASIQQSQSDANQQSDTNPARDKSVSVHGPSNRQHSLHVPSRSPSRSQVTVIIREFEEFENRIVSTVLNIQYTFKDVHVVVIGDKYPYPPLQTKDISKARFHYISLSSDFWNNVSSSRPETFLKSEYVMIIPDSTSFQESDIFPQLSQTLRQNSSVKILAIPLGDFNVGCNPVSINLKRWTLEYGDPKASKESLCNNVIGDHAVFLRTSDLLQLSRPYLRPFPQSLYLQAAARQWGVRTVDTPTSISFTPLYQSDPHIRWKHKHNHELRETQMYRNLGIKLVIQASGRRHWYGCSKDSQRCFDTVVEDMPEYLYRNKWTPPCCLRALRETARHVFGILDQCKARYWLEGGSLLGAARSGDIIPWDYDVDVGIYKEDVDKCDYLRQCSKGSYVDEAGFVWEKAKEGDFYRVQYSETNRLHVDIFPFFPRNGTMTKRTWMKTHRQDTEFPEHYLKPLTKIAFAGLQANAPNNVKQFLEFKFGVNVIENPKYPNAQNPV